MFMGKSLIIFGADFSANGFRSYYYGVSDEQINEGTGDWVESALGFAIIDQSAIQGNTIRGVRLKVSEIGTIKIYKSDRANANSRAYMTEVATLTATETGLQDIDFSQPIVLGENEYIHFGAWGDSTTLKAAYKSTRIAEAPVLQRFYIYTGSDNIIEATGNQSLNVDFY